MSETKPAAPTILPAQPKATATVQTARPRQESRGWLALILQVFGFAGAGIAGFAASHYFTTQQQASAERQKATAEVQATTTVATQAVPAAAPAESGQPAEESTAPANHFSDDVERAEMTNGGQAVPLEEVEATPSDVKVETFDGQPVENSAEPSTP
jgi:hypothetical protein